jgi:hypothetical protein
MSHSSELTSAHTRSLSRPNLKISRESLKVSQRKVGDKAFLVTGMCQMHM